MLFYRIVQTFLNVRQHSAQHYHERERLLKESLINPVAASS